MNAPTLPLELPSAVAGLPAMVDRAAAALASARTPAEILEAREMAGLAFDAARRAKRLAKAQQAKANLIASAHRAGADALEIEAAAKQRFADEYDAAQAGGLVRTSGERSFSHPEKLSGTDIIPPKDLHEARLIRDAEEIEPGVVRRALDKTLADGDEPNRAAVREAVIAAAKRGQRGGKREDRSNPNFKPPSREWEAMLAVSAGSREMMAALDELGAADDPGLVLRGFIDEGQRERNLADIRQCRDFLTRVLEVADAR